MYKRQVKCIQVKSTINTFSKSDIKIWITDIIKDMESPEYELFLIGQCDKLSLIHISMAVMQNGMSLMGIDGLTQQLVQGIILIVVVVISFDRKNTVVIK